MEKVVTLEEVLELTKQLPLIEKIRLIERIAPHIERELETAQPKPRKSLRGLWRGLEITEEDIAEARREMWGNLVKQCTPASMRRPPACEPARAEE